MPRLVESRQEGCWSQACASRLSNKCSALRRYFMCSTLLCVFLLTAEHNGVTNDVTHGASDSSAGKGSRQVKGATLILKQFHALLVKRFHHAVRSQKDFMAQVQMEMQRRVAQHDVLTVELCDGSLE